ncbi:ANTAR domain-containing protein [Streptomyces sp. NPDC014806]|uniref:ANTAR domain-containing protein n=1 Tax=Streptomyces sp. NPDC014806 TaxID=3364920 RepID=UPI0036FC164B
MPEPAYEESSSAGNGLGCSVTTGLPPGRRPVLPVVDVRPDGEQVRITVRGELDLDAGESLDRALRSALTRSTGGVELDLSEVAFCDCSALNVLLSHRRRALDEGKTLTVGAASAGVLRLLELTGTAALFAVGADAGGGAGKSSAQEDGATLDELRVEVVQLRRAMQTRPVIDLARGILMASFGLSAEDAWTVLVLASQNTNIKLHHLARDLVEAVDGDALSESVQEQLAAAVAKVTAPPPGEEGTGD